MFKVLVVEDDKNLRKLMITYLKKNEIVKRIIELSKGKISVKSKEGQGTTFTIELPNNL